MALKRGLGKGLDSLIPTNVMMESEVKHATVSTASSAEEGKDGTLMVKLSRFFTGIGRIFKTIRNAAADSCTEPW